MRHRVYGKHLGRDKDERQTLFRGLVRQLFLHESIITTETKAKAIKGLVDRLVSKGKKTDTASQSRAGSFLASKEITKKFIEEIVPQLTARNSGFTSIVKLGQRAGDGAMMVKISLVKDETSKEREQKPAKEAKKEEKSVSVKVPKKQAATKKGVKS